MPRPRIADVELLCRFSLWRSDEEGVVRIAVQPGLRREHFNPLGVAARRSEPCVRHADRHDATRPWEERIRAAIENECRLPFSDVKTLLEGVHVRIDVSLRLEGTQPETHVHRPNGRV